jgi:hypothetical protein
MKVRVIRVFRVPDYDTRITRNKFGFCKLLPEILEPNSGSGISGSGIPGSGFELQVFWPPLVSPQAGSRVCRPKTTLQIVHLAFYLFC